jgi:hypothetical protein
MSEANYLPTFTMNAEVAADPKAFVTLRFAAADLGDHLELVQRLFYPAPDIKESEFARP